MPFHNYARPLDLVGLFPTARAYIYNDADTVAGNVVFDVQFSGMIREAGSNRLDSPTAYNYPGVSPDAGPGPRITGTNWGVIGGQIYNSVGGGTTTLLSLLGTNGYVHNDISVDVTAFDNIAGISAHIGSDQQFYMVYLDMAALRVKAAVRNGAYGTVVIYSGTTPITAGHTYRLRVAEAADETVSVYLDGGLAETFSLAGIQYGAGYPVSGITGLGLVSNTSSARFANFYVAPTTALPTATNYTVRNYDGDITYAGTFAALTDPTKLTIPDSGLKQRSNRGPYGWYRVNVYGPNRGDGQWNDSYGDCAFIRIRPASGFPSNGLISQPGSGGGWDEYARGVMAMGPARYGFSSRSPYDPVAIGDDAGAVKGAPIAKTVWADYATSLRPRHVLGAFPDGLVWPYKQTAPDYADLLDSHLVPTLAATPTITAWETRNEPNFSLSPTDFINAELIPFYNKVKSVNPALWVLAPGNVSFNHSNIGYLSSFLQAGGANYCDAISVHAYNCFNGDMALARLTLGMLKYWINFWGANNKPLFQTEQGFAHEYAGLFYPRYAGRWTAHMWFMCELYGIPVENNGYWYDTPLGFDTFPMYFLNSSGIGPQPAPIRTMVVEVGNRVCTSQFNFDDPPSAVPVATSLPYGNNLYAGGTWTGGDGSKVVGLIAGSYGMNDLVLDVSGATSLTCSDTWGNTFTLPVVNGRATFPIAEMPQWIRCPVGVTVTPVPLGLTNNVAPAATITTDVTSRDGTYDGTNTYQSAIYIPTGILNNGIQENQHGRPEGGGWMIYAPVLPFNINLEWSSPQQINRVLIHTYPPWQSNGIPIGLHIDTWDGATWTTRYTRTRPTPKSFPFTSASPRCTYETYWDEQWIYDASFASVTTSKVRVVIDDCTWASGETGPGGAYDALWGGFGGGLTGGPPGTVQTCRIREIEVFGVGVPHTVSARGMGGATGSSRATRTTGTSDAQHAANLQAMRPYVRPDEQAAIDRAVALLAP